MVNIANNNAHQGEHSLITTELQKNQCNKTEKMQSMYAHKSFNVSFNQLKGEIPNEGVFTNLTAESFMGNEGLCGISKLQVPHCATNTTSHRKRRVKMIVLKYILPAAASSALVLISLLTWWIIRLYQVKKRQVSTPLDLESVEVHRMISYQELRKATNSFSESNLLGKGSFSSVYKALLSDGTITAVKVLNLQREGALKSFDVECQVISRIKHRNLIKIVSICSYQEFRALILQYMPNGSLEKWLYSHQRIQVMLDVAMALDYLHNDYFEPVVHCDLKPSNILFDEDMVAHVGDFGIAKILAESNCSTQTVTLGTIGYIAPEYGSEGRVSTSCDVYSYGIVLMETFTRKRPTDDMFTEDSSLRQWVSALYPHKVMEAVDTNLLTNDGNWTGKMQDCLSSITQLALDCSQNLPEERINMREVVTRLRNIQSEV
ncbi:non-specific serine/threonine protein kinase [Ranunculus cassubicifolius]